jgi:hypothetical protein
MSDMQTAYRVAALAVRQRFAEQHPRRLESLNRLQARDVAVYSGSYDHVEEVLKCLGVPCAMDPDPNSLNAHVVFAICSGNYPKGLLERVAGYVEDGGWLVTSDWGLEHILEAKFPGTARWTQRGTGDEVISVEPALDSLWSGIVVLGADPQWWLEGGSHPIEVLDPGKVQVEAASHDLLVRYGAPVAGVAFDWGAGHVYHIISHFWHRRSRTPAERFRGPCVDFLRAGMRLSEAGIEKVLRQARIQPETLNFAMLQSAATATELVAQLCARATGRVARGG